MPIRERYVWVCTNRREDSNPKGSCAQKGSEALLDQLKRASAAAGLTRSVRVMASGCIDVCEHGIAIAVQPDHTLVGNVTVEDIPALVEGFRTPMGVARDAAFSSRLLVPPATEPAR